MSDFTTLKLQANTASSTPDATPTWADLTFQSSGQATAGYELRANKSGNGATGTTPSASWPSILKPTSGSQLLDQLWLFTADAVGNQIVDYDGTGSHYNQLRWNWDALGTFASAPLISAWKDYTLPPASPGTQNSATTGGDGSSIINGCTESSNRSLLKATVYGFGVTSGGAADNPSANMGSNPTVTSGNGSGAVTTASGTWSAWQDLQAATDWIANGTTPKTLTAGTWNFLIALYIAASMTGGTLVPVIGLQYTWI